MADRNRPAGKRPGTKPGARPATKSTPSSAANRAAARAPQKKPGKSIVNQKQTPWGLIITAVVIAALAVGVIGYAVSHKSGSKPSSHSSSSVSPDPSDPYRQPEVAAAKQISGIQWHIEPDHTHVTSPATYDTTPPTGGNHSPFWADCSGTVYPQAIANENAVHMLEHGAIWITYNAETLPAAQLATLTKLVNGVDRMALSPYPNLKTPISLQAWNYQLFVNSADDPRIPQFIAALRYNQKVTPEYGATCSDPQFKSHPSTFGHPLWAPAG